jgi:hypothetical protein
MAWMTSSLFSVWLLNFDWKIKLENQKVILFIDNCTAHNHNSEFSSIKVHFLPPNTTYTLAYLPRCYAEFQNVL